MGGVFTPDNGKDYGGKLHEGGVMSLRLIAVPGETQGMAQAFGHTWEKGQGAMTYQYSSLRRILVV